ncbi:FkbM family methyltransferase [Haloferax denitrificans]|uniref:FkbM family methyltransferase n=1 Tax=Haloferax denitrificans TaxID=35745 RepID=UPI003C6F9B43
MTLLSGQISPIVEGLKDWLYSRAEDRTETYIFRRLKERGFRPSVILDIGAYEGAWSKDMHAIFPGTEFILVEPLEEKSEELRTLSLDNVTVLNALLGEQSEERTFYEMETGSSYYPENTDFDRKTTKKTVVTANELLDDFDLSGGLVKIDAQGAELDILKGATDILPDIDALYLEVSLVNYNEGSPRAEDVIEYLFERGFKMYDIGTKHRRGGQLIQVDLLFINDDVSLPETWKTDAKSGNV